VKGRSYLSLNFACAAGLSGETPTTAAPFFANFFAVAELAGFHRAARRIGPGIEIQHHALALERGQLETPRRYRCAA
jgi:hypothetical protein